MTPVDVALAYYQAWTTGDFAKALPHLSPEVHCDSPAGPLSGVDALRDYMAPFAQLARKFDLLAAHGDDTTALLMYDTETPAVPSAPGAELHTVTDGRIVHIRLIFDRLPFAQARTTP